MLLHELRQVKVLRHIDGSLRQLDLDVDALHILLDCGLNGSSGTARDIDVVLGAGDGAGRTDCVHLGVFVVWIDDYADLVALLPNERWLRHRHQLRGVVRLGRLANKRGQLWFVVTIWLPLLLAALVEVDLC